MDEVELKNTLDEFMSLIKQEHNFKHIIQEPLVTLESLGYSYKVLEREHEEVVFLGYDFATDLKTIPEKEIKFEDIAVLKIMYNKAKAFEMYKKYASELIKLKLKDTPRQVVNQTCPSCKQQIEYNKLYKYCPLCGQAIIYNKEN